MARRIKPKYFEVKPLLKKYPKARYYFILGGRGTGKTYPVIAEALTDAIRGKGKFAYVRRHKESLSSFNLQQTFGVHDKLISDLTNGAFNHIKYWRRQFWLELLELNPETGLMERTAKSDEPIGIALSMSTWETDKGADFGFDSGIKHIILDEALSKAGQYLNDEWAVFQNVISSLVRDRWQFDTKIWLLANPISKWANPYFRNMGIDKKLLNNPGITEIKYPDDKGGTAMSSVFAYIGLVAGEIDPNREAVYNTFFAFQHSKGKSKSITHGYWEMEDSSRLPSGVYEESTKNRTVYLIFGEERLAIDIMKYDYTNKYYLMVYPTDKIRDKTYYLILGTSLDKYAVVGYDNSHPIAQLIFKIHDTGQVYYSDDATADAFHGFLIERLKYRV